MIPQKREKDTGWIDINFNDGFSKFADWSPCQVRRIGDIVHLRGIVKGFSNINHTVISIIPHEFWPTCGEQFVSAKINEADKAVIFTVDENGRVIIISANFNPTVDDGILIYTTWFVD